LNRCCARATKRDACFGEDRTRSRNANALINLALLRSTILRLMELSLPRPSLTRFKRSIRSQSFPLLAPHPSALMASKQKALPPIQKRGRIKNENVASKLIASSVSNTKQSAGLFSVFMTVISSPQGELIDTKIGQNFFFSDPTAKTPRLRSFTAEEIDYL
jgi:hypothetical protein